MSIRASFLTAICTCLLIGNAAGHSQSPRLYGGEGDPLDAITLSPVKVVPVTIGNLNDYPQAYYLVVDGVQIGTTDVMSSSTFRVMNIPVSMESPNTPEIHKVCSISIAKKDQTIRTRICTTVKLYWKL